MTLKSLVTGVAAAAVMGGAAMGVTSIASPAIASADCASVDQLRGVIDGLAAPGVGFHSGKSDLVAGGIGIFEGKTADKVLSSKYADGSLPVAYSISDPVCNPQDGTATATISAPSGTSQTIAFVPGGRLGWQLSRGSALQALTAFSG